MSAFARALAVLHANANLSVACTWAPGWDRDLPRTLVMDLQTGEASLSTDGEAVRGIRNSDQSPAFGVGPMGGIAPREAIDIAVADISGDAMRGDLVEIGADRFTVEAVERDIEALTWRLTLSDSQ